MISAVFIDRPRLAIVISIVIALGGLLALTRIPVAQLPDIVPIPLQHQRRSDWYENYSGANIILITLESISQSQVAFLSGQGARMPVFETFARRGLSSQRHFCVSPNTNNALAALYKGNYRSGLTFPHLQTLHENGYKSVAIVPQDSAGFGLDQLLRRIGFQHVIDLCFAKLLQSADPRTARLRDKHTAHRHIPVVGAVAASLWSKRFNDLRPQFLGVIFAQVPLAFTDKKNISARLRPLH